jgi:glyoxylase-like metal-dependent hydrolase (beta-lactamase superfamily II)
VGSAVIQVAPGVFRIPLPHPYLLFSNVYLISGEINVLIDAGHFATFAQEQLQRAFHELRVPVESVSRVLLTDAGTDRTGYLLGPPKPRPVRVSAHRELSHPLRDYGEYSLQFRRELILPLFEDARLYRRVDLSSLDTALNLSYRAGGSITNHSPLSAGMRVNLGERRLHVIETPGPTATHLSYWLEPDRLLFSGDLGANEGKELPLMIRGLGGSLKGVFSSISDLSKLPARILLPAHGEPVLSTELAWARLHKVAVQERENLRALLLAGPRELATLLDFLSLGHGYSQIRLVHKVATLRLVLADLVAAGDIEELYEDRILTYRLAARSLRSSRLKQA